MNKVDMEVYHQIGGTYVVPTEIMNLLLDENENINKGIDELLKKYEDKKAKVLWEYEELGYSMPYILYEEIITDLKKLKGE